MSLPFEVDAANGKPMPRGLTLAQQKAYLALRALHKQFRDRLISKEKASAEKELIVEAFELERSKEVFLERSALELNQRIAAASAAYKAHRSLENADALYAALYNIPASEVQQEPKN